MRSPRRPPRWRVPVGLTVVLVAAALFRAIYFHALSRAGVLFDGLILDAAIYDGWGRRIAAGDWMGLEAFYFAPLYPYVLGLLYRLLGHSFALIYLLQGLLGLVSIGLVHRVATRLFGPRAALIAAAGAALYLPFAFFETKVLGTTLALTLGLVALLLLVRAEEQEDGPAGTRHRRRWPLAGFAIGLTALCAPSALLLAMLSAASLATRRRIGSSSALLAGTAVALLPALAHNVTASGDWLLVSAQGGITFYQGNNAGARGFYAPPPGFSGAPERQADEERALAESEAGRALRRSEVSAHFFRKGLGFILDSPGRWLLLEARKLSHLLGSYEAATEYSLYQEREAIPLLWAAFLPYAVILGAACGALLTRPWSSPPGRREDPSASTGGAVAGRRALLQYALCTAAAPLLFYVSSRYRLPLVPALLIYGGAFASRLAADLRATGGLSASTRRGFLGGLILALISFFPLGQRSVTVEANVHYNLAGVLADRGRHEEAVAELDRCLADWPEHAFALVNRGNSLDRLGRADEALASYRRAQEARPDLWVAYQAEGLVLSRRGQYDAAVEAYRRGARAGRNEAWLRIGTTRAKQGRLDEAEEAFRESIRIVPGDVQARVRLADLLVQRGEEQQAIREYRKALEKDPENARAKAALARLRPAEE